MKIFKFSKTVLLAALLVSSLSAETDSGEDEVASSKCSILYDTCLEKCDKTQDGSQECYKVCEEEYSNCSDDDSEQEQ